MKTLSQYDIPYYYCSRPDTNKPHAGTRSWRPLRQHLNIEPDRAQLARYGLTVGKVVSRR